MAQFSTWPVRAFTIDHADNPPLTIAVKGRDRWALEALMKAGARGCTPMDNPAPRWSAYVHNLRALGVPIKTIHETHAGPFAGTHGRYVLACNITPGGAA